MEPELRGHGHRLSGVPRLVRAVRVLFTALAWAVRHEEAVRLEVIGILLWVPLGLYLGETGVERSLLAGSVVLILVVELLNTAVEVTVDRIGLEEHELSGLAKDLGSAAVGVTLLLGIAVWGLVLFW